MIEQKVLLRNFELPLLISLLHTEICQFPIHSDRPSTPGCISRIIFFKDNELTKPTKRKNTKWQIRECPRDKLVDY